MSDDQTTLLDYWISTDPAPVEISTTQVTNQARVNVGAATPDAVYCNEIVVAVPVGSDATSLFAETPDGSVNTNKWAITAELRRGSELWAGLDSDQVYSTFTYDCVSSTDYLIDYNLVFGVFGAVAGVVGDVSIGILETSGTSSDPSTFTTKTAYFPVRKEWPQFYLKNLTTTAPSTPTVPTTDFASGAPIRFAWESNGTYFQLFMKDQTAPIYSGTMTTCTLSGGVTRDTTFVLAASMTGSPGQDIPQGGYEPIYLYDSIGVTVANPVLNPTSVTVSNTLGVTGTSTLGTTTTGALTSASAAVSGAVTAGSAAVSGAVTAGSAAVSGTVAANTVRARYLAGPGGGSPLIMDDNGHSWLLKWVGQTSQGLQAQIFMWDNNERWGGLILPILGYKTFIIPHPLDAERYLVHATLEGPEAGVFYRGSAALVNGRAEVALPPYADALCDPESWTVQVTPVGGFDRLAVQPVEGRRVAGGRFVVVSDDPASAQKFDWEAKATRRDQAPLDVEPSRSDLGVRGVGPYTFGVPVSAS